MSTLGEHVMNHDHDIAWEDATVADADFHMYCRRALNAWHRVVEMYGYYILL